MSVPAMQACMRTTLTKFRCSFHQSFATIVPGLETVLLSVANRFWSIGFLVVGELGAYDPQYKLLMPTFID